MNQITDEELTRQLDRRTTASLGDTDRDELLASVAQASRNRVAAQSWWFRPAKWLAPAAALVVLALVVAPLAFPAGQRPSTKPTTDTAGATPSPHGVAAASPSPSPAVRPVVILSTDQLAVEVVSPSAVGTVVLANVAIAPMPMPSTGESCPVDVACQIGEIAGVSFEISVMSGWRASAEGEGTKLEKAGVTYWRQRLENPTGPGPFAFRVLLDRVEYLGPIVETPGGETAWTVSGIQAGEHAEPSDALYAVTGWLVATSPVPCPGPPDPRADIGYYCGRSWLTQEETYAVDANQSQFRVALDGLHVQWEAYDDFARGPMVDGPRGAEPRFGTYLVRSVGCPPVVMGDCPVWSMVGRLDNYSPPAAGDTPFPSEIAGEHVLTADEAPAHVAASGSAEPFLVGGYVWFVEADCVVPPDFPRTPLLAVCDDGVRLSSTPGDSWSLTSFRLALLEDVGLRSTQGRLVVLRVHGHDPLAADCPQNYRTRCEGAIVVNDAVWPTPVQAPEASPTGLVHDLPSLAVGNWTTLRVFVYVNGMDAAVLEPGQVLDPIDPGMLRQLPWHVEATTSSGRVLLILDVLDGDGWHSGPDPSGASSVHGVAARAELSCGRLDIWSGPPLAGPAPPSSFTPGDCDP